MWWPSFRKSSGETSPPIADSESAFSSDFTDEDQALVNKVAERIVRMRMTVPAIFFLESSKPLAFLGGQLLIFLEPFVQTLFNFRQYQRFAFLMEDRDNWERLIKRVEDLEAEYLEREKQAKQDKKDAEAEKRK
jgi:hypothetical protein